MGQTIHSWCGVGIKDFITEYDLEIMETRAPLYRRITTTSVLILDEISMVSAGLLDSLNKPISSMSVILFFTPFAVK